MTLDELFLETASIGATGAESVAGFRGSLFSGGEVSTSTLVARTLPSSYKIKKLNTTRQRKQVSGVPVLQLNNEVK